MIPILIKVLGKLGAISGLVSLIPGGQILGAIGGLASAVLSFLGWCLHWVLADIGDAFREPQKGIVRVLCGLVVLGVGAYSGIKHEEAKDAAKIHQLTRLLVAATNERDQWRARHADQEKRATEADKARAEAEAKLAKATAPAPAAEPAKRVRPRATSAAAAGSGPGLFGFPAHSK